METSKPLVSVIVPIYKVEEYLHPCVDSILAQTYPNIELILVDDGSPDASPAICDSYAEQDPRVRVIHKPNGGISSARNAGLDAAQGTFISFVDGDDTIMPSTCEEALCALHAYPLADVVSFDSFREEASGNSVRGSGKALFYPPEEAYRQYLTYGVLPCAWGKLYRRTCLNGMRFRPIPCAEDVAFTAAVYANCRGAVLLDRALYFYRQRPSSAVSGSPLKMSLCGYQVDCERYAMECERFPALQGLAAGRYAKGLLRAHSRLLREGTDYASLCAEIRGKLYALPLRRLPLKERLSLYLFRLSPALFAGILRVRDKIRFGS